MDYFPSIMRPAARAFVIALPSFLVLAGCGGVGSDRTASAIVAGSPAGDRPLRVPGRRDAADARAAGDSRRRDDRAGPSLPEPPRRRRQRVARDAGGGGAVRRRPLPPRLRDQSRRLPRRGDGDGLGRCGVDQPRRAVRPRGKVPHDRGGNYFAPDKEVAMVEQTVVDLRVAIDILVSAAHVDPRGSASSAIPGVPRPARSWLPLTSGRSPSC